MPLEYAAPPPPPQPAAKQPRLLLVLVPALLVEIALAVLAVSQPGNPPVGGAVFAVLMVALLGFASYHGYATAKWVLASLWVIRGSVALGAAIGKYPGPLVYAMGAFYLLAAAGLLLVPTRGGVRQS